MSVLKNKHEKLYNLELSKSWNHSDILTIRLEMFSDYIKDTGMADKEKLRTVIEYLNDNYGSTKYNYKLTETLAILLIGAWLSGLISASLSEAKRIIETNQLIISVGILFIMVILYIERLVIKEIVLWNRSRNNRLKQIIYCYLVEK